MATTNDLVILDGDEVVFAGNFGSAVVMVRPGTIRGSAVETPGARKVCVLGDEKSVSVTGCSYTSASYPIPGTGTLTIASLASDQIATTKRLAGRAVLLKGSKFAARFAVASPAKRTGSEGALVPDSQTEYAGTGNFITSNTTIRAS